MTTRWNYSLRSMPKRAGERFLGLWHWGAPDRDVVHIIFAAKKPTAGMRYLTHEGGEEAHYVQTPHAWAPLPKIRRAGLTDFRAQLLKLADGSRTIEEIAAKVEGYSHHRDGPGRPSAALVGSTLSQMKNAGLAVSYKVHSNKKKPADAELQKHLASIEKGEMSIPELAEKYGASYSAARMWVIHASYHKKYGKQNDN